MCQGTHLAFSSERIKNRKLGRYLVPSLKRLIIAERNDFVIYIIVSLGNYRR
jgi:hypothetical protein